jgi:hypothetical protein
MNADGRPGSHTDPSGERADAQSEAVPTGESVGVSRASSRLAPLNGEHFGTRNRQVQPAQHTYHARENEVVRRPND